MIGRPESRRLGLALLAGVGYGLFYLYAIGDLSLASSSQWGWRAGEISLASVFDARGPFLYEAVAIVEAGRAVLLVSPLNLVIMTLLAGLSAANIHGVLTLRAKPAACRPRRGGVVAGAAPALMAGGACCAPGLVLLLGVPGLGAFSAFFGWLTPVSIVALGLNRVWQRRRGAPPIVRWSRSQSRPASRRRPVRSRWRSLLRARTRYPARRRLS